jgi:periplasmic protein TonB
MFDAIANPNATGRTGGSIAASLLLHGILASAVLALIHARGPRPPAIEMVPLPPLRVGPPPSAPSGSAVKKSPAKSRHPPTKPVEPREIPRTEAPPPDAVEGHGQAISGAESLAGDGEVDVIGGTPGGDGAPSWPAEPGPVEFSGEMTPPRKIAGPDPQYTPEALEREIQGTLVVKCTVTAQGVVRDCRVIKSVPYMDRAVIDALECRRYTPALLHGQPVEVDYSFRVQVKLPR